MMKRVRCSFDSVLHHGFKLSSLTIALFVGLLVVSETTFCHGYRLEARSDSDFERGLSNYGEEPLYVPQGKAKTRH